MKIIERLHKWLSGTGPPGLGTLLIGVAALIALWGTNSVLDKILEVQKQAQDMVPLSQ